MCEVNEDKIKDLKRLLAQGVSMLQDTDILNDYGDCSYCGANISMQSGTPVHKDTCEYMNFIKNAQNQLI